MIKWDDLTPLQRLRSAYSDLHKDVTGMRPDYAAVDAMSEPELREEYNRLVEMFQNDAGIQFLSESSK